MESIYLGIVLFLFLLAIFDLVVGVSNDAVNFLGSAVGARAASFKWIMGVAAVGILCGAVMSNGMMDVARHGIFRPELLSVRSCRFPKSASHVILKNQWPAQTEDAAKYIFLCFQVCL